MPRQYTFDVAVQNRHTLLKTQGCNCGGSGWPYAFECLQLIHTFWKHTSKFADHLLRARMQVTRPAVIAQTAPQTQHLV